MHVIFLHCFSGTEVIQNFEKMHVTPPRTPPVSFAVDFTWAGNQDIIL